jgi:hypothetical protein
MILVTWPAIIVAGLGYFAAPQLISMVLGAGWESADNLAGIAVLLGVVPMVSAPLSSSLEAQGHFMANIIGWLLGACSIAVGALATSRSGDPRLAMWGLTGAALFPILTCAPTLERLGVLQVRGWLRGAFPVAVLQIAMTALLAGIVTLVEGNLETLVAVALVGTAEIGLLWLFRERTSFAQVATRYGLPGFR